MTYERIIGFVSCPYRDTKDLSVLVTVPRKNGAMTIKVHKEHYRNQYVDSLLGKWVLVNYEPESRIVQGQLVIAPKPLSPIVVIDGIPRIRVQCTLKSSLNGVTILRNDMFGDIADVDNVLSSDDVRPTSSGIYNIWVIRCTRDRYTWLVSVYQGSSGTVVIDKYKRERDRERRRTRGGRESHLPPEPSVPSRQSVSSTTLSTGSRSRQAAPALTIPEKKKSTSAAKPVASTKAAWSVSGSPVKGKPSGSSMKSPATVTTSNVFTYLDDEESTGSGAGRILQDEDLHLLSSSRSSDADYEVIRSEVPSPLDSSSESMIASLNLTHGGGSSGYGAVGTFPANVERRSSVNSCNISSADANGSNLSSDVEVHSVLETTRDAWVGVSDTDTSKIINHPPLYLPISPVEQQVRWDDRQEVFVNTEIAQHKHQNQVFDVEEEDSWSHLRGAIDSFGRSTSNTRDVDVPVMEGLTEKGQVQKSAPGFEQLNPSMDQAVAAALEIAPSYEHVHMHPPGRPPGINYSMTSQLPMTPPADMMYPTNMPVHHMPQFVAPRHPSLAPNSQGYMFDMLRRVMANADVRIAMRHHDPDYFEEVMNFLLAF